MGAAGERPASLPEVMVGVVNHEIPSSRSLSCGRLFTPKRPALQEHFGRPEALALHEVTLGRAVFPRDLQLKSFPIFLARSVTVAPNSLRHRKKPGILRKSDIRPVRY
jgi:hypothetical protein